ncbi:LamG domain-containing protein [candidate division KSB1 bacterium]
MKLKAQASFEFIMLIGFMMIMFVTFFAIATDQIADMNLARRDKIAQDILDTIVTEFELAHQSLDGYSRNFTLPDYVEGQSYEITLYKNRMLVLIYMDKTYNEELPFELEGSSNVYKGINRIHKLNGGVGVVAGDDPCYPGGLPIAGTNSYCIGGECYCTSGNYAYGEEFGSLNNICTHENDFKLTTLECSYGCVDIDWCNPAPAIEPVDPYNPTVIVDVNDSSALLDFQTNESAMATVRYDVVSGSCSLWDNLAGEITSSGFQTSFEDFALSDLVPETRYCFRIRLIDQKGASQDYGTNILPGHEFITEPDQSAPVLRSVRFDPVLSDTFPTFDYGQPIQLIANITDHTGVDLDETYATIKQDVEGNLVDIITLNNFEDEITTCYGKSIATPNERDDDIYIHCFEIDNNFAKHGSYRPDQHTMLYSSFDVGFDADFARGSKTATLTNLAIVEDIVAARFGNGLEIGTGEYLTYPGSNNYNTDSGTIEFWIRPSLMPPSSPEDLVIIKGPSSPFQNDLRIFIESSTLSSWIIDSSGNQKKIDAATTQLSINTWYFVAFTWDNLNSGNSNAEMHIYINGVEEGMIDSESINLVLNSNIFIGSDIFSGTSTKPTIDQFRILDYAKSGAEIMDDYDITREYFIYFRTQDTNNPAYVRENIKPGQYDGPLSFPVNYKII